MFAAAEQRAELDLQVSLLADAGITKVVELVSMIADQMKLKAGEEEEVDMKQRVAPESVLDAIEEAEANSSDDRIVPVKLRLTWNSSTNRYYAGADEVLHRAGKPGARSLWREGGPFLGCGNSGPGGQAQDRGDEDDGEDDDRRYASGAVPAAFMALFVEAAPALVEEVLFPVVHRQVVG